jgi:hypothetical protein
MLGLLEKGLRAEIGQVPPAKFLLAGDIIEALL